MRREGKLWVGIGDEDEEGMKLRMVIGMRMGVRIRRGGRLGMNVMDRNGGEDKEGMKAMGRNRGKDEERRKVRDGVRMRRGG